MNVAMLDALLVQIIASVVGVFVGALAALATDRHNTHRLKKQRAQTVVRILTLELTENYETLRAVEPAYQTTPWGKSFYVNTMAWETVLAEGDLPEILGYDLADRLAEHYGCLVRIRYYVDLLTRLWFAPEGIAGYEEIRKGFRQAIVEAMEKAFTGHAEVMQLIRQGAWEVKGNDL